jgi:glycosyltransferase involved in cell wall biosynthesis
MPFINKIQHRQEKNMKVSISVKGCFHAFHLAKQLQKAGALHTLITSYPTFKTEKYGIKKEKVRSFFVNEIMERGFKKLPKSLQRCYDPQFFFQEYYDKKAAKAIPKNSDLLVAWSSAALHTIRAAKKRNIPTLVERGSSHIQFQQAILQEEYNRLGLAPPITHHPKTIEKELQEYQEADYLCVPSQYVARTMIEKNIPAEKIIQIPYGVDPTYFNPLPKEDTVFRVIFAGNACIRKGVHYLLQAFSELNLPNAELWLIGTQAPEIRPFIEKFATSNVHCKGPFPEFELAKYYAQGSVFCLPSIEEGLAMVQLQAMACALPVICTTHTGGEDVIREGQDGFVLPIRDVDALKEKILHLYENPDLAKTLGESARKHVLSHYTWDHYGQKAIQAYAQLLDKRKK